MTQRRLAILDDHPPGPGYDANRDLLVKLLAQVGIAYQSCLHVGLDELPKLAEWQPHMVLVLDWQRDKKRSGLLALTGEKKAVDDWRGSVLLAKLVVPGTKLMATYHPNRLKVEWGLTGIVRLDMARLAKELVTDGLDVPEDVIRVDWSVAQLLNALGQLRTFKMRVAIDIEGYPDWVSCIGFAVGHNEAFVVPFIHDDGTSYWSESEELALWQAVADVLEDPAVPKVLQNSLYDNFVLAWSYGIVVAGVADDTMLKHFELYPEFEKSLGFQTSIYTRHPFYKHQRKSDDERVQLEYCGRDCCRTLECCDVQEGLLKPKQKEHYQFNLSLLNPLLYMELRGIKYDYQAAGERLSQVQGEIFALQDQINREAASGRPDLGRLYAALDGQDGQFLRESQPEVVAQDAQAGQVASQHGRHSTCPPILPTGRKDGGDSSNTDWNKAGSQPGVDNTSQARAGLHVDQTPQRLDSSALIPLFTQAFCKAESLRRERRQVEEVWWQPRKWNGKKWVKAGKQVKEMPDPATMLQEDSGEFFPLFPGEHPISYSKVRKAVTKLVPVAIQTWPDVVRFTKDSCKAECKRAIALASHEGGLGAGERGELATLLGIHVKLNATGRGKDVTQADGTVERGAERDANWFVYDHCKAPRQYARENGKPTDRLTSSTPAVLLAYIATQDPRLRVFMSWRAADTMREALTAKADLDGRIRCTYILPGTNTCRIACKEGNTGSGYNLQTVTEPLRYLFPADEGCDFGQIDLKGADGWTIAALCAELGDRTMLDDLLCGLKPVNIIVLLYTEGPHINQLSREELKVAQKRVDKASWQYIATKPIFYGYTYLMGARKMSEGIAEDSYAETGVATVVSPAKCEGIMRMIDARYPGIKRVQAAAATRMIRDGILTTSQGWQRRFYGRKSHKVQVGGQWVERPDRTTHGAWLGTLPQFITTYVTKLGLAKLWADPDNRRPDDSLRVEPLHTVHDSLNPMWRVEDREFAKAKILPVWFNNEVQVAGQTLTIPASGTYGRSWGQQPHSL